IVKAPEESFPQFPIEEAQVARPNMSLDLRVKSETPLKSVRLLRNNVEIKNFPLEPGQKTVEVPESILLARGIPATFKRVATNEGNDTGAGGASQQSLTLECPKRPVYVLLDSIKSPRKGGNEVTSLPFFDLRGNTIVDQAVPDGDAEMQGRLIWS